MSPEKGHDIVYIHAVERVKDSFCFFVSVSVNRVYIHAVERVKDSFCFFVSVSINRVYIYAVERVKDSSVSLFQFPYDEIKQ